MTGRRVTTPDGQRKRVTVYGKTWEETHEKWAELKAQAAKQPIAVKVPTVGGTSPIGLKRSSSRTGKTAYSAYELSSRLYVIPGIGKKSIDPKRLTVRAAQTWLNTLATTCQCCAAQGREAQGTAMLRGQGMLRELPEPPRDRGCADKWPVVCICGTAHQLLFTTSTGQPLEPRNVKRSFDTRCKRAGVRQIKIHDTRRTCGSLLAALDVHPRVAMAILRHSQIALTMEVYTQVPDKTTREALQRLGDLLDGHQRAGTANGCG